MKLVVQVKLVPTAAQAVVLAETLHACNAAANRVSRVAFDTGTTRNYDLRKATYRQVREAGIGSQAAQHVIKKVADAYTTLHANLQAGNLGRPGSTRRVRAENKPIVFRADAAQPFDPRNLSMAVDAGTVSIWTVRGRCKDIAFTCSTETRKMLADCPRGESDLLCRDGKWLLLITVNVPEPPVNTDPGGVCGGGPGHRQHRHHLVRVPGGRAWAEPAPGPADGAAPQTPAQAHQGRQACAEAAAPPGAAPRDRCQSLCFETDRGRG